MFKHIVIWQTNCLFCYKTMVCSKLRKYCTFNDLFQLLCIILTLFLIFHELVNYTITRPTTVSSEEGVLDEDTFPQITVCLDPGLSLTDILKLGYPETSSFYRGSSDGRKFVGLCGTPSWEHCDENY